MHGRTIGAIATLCLILTALWLTSYIAGLVLAGPLDTFEQVLAYASDRGTLYDLIYINAALVTIAATMLYAGLYAHCRRSEPGWSAIGQPFVAVYCLLNLFVYLSQITVVPRLTVLHEAGTRGPAAEMLLRQMIQSWTGSTVAFLNALGYAVLGYAVLGIPSIIFGLILSQKSDGRSLAGILLAFNGLACIVGLIGAILGDQVLRTGTVVGGVIFLLALFPLRRAMLRYHATNSRRRSRREHRPEEV